VTYWLFLRGLGGKPLDAKVDPAAIRGQSSSKRPSVERGVVEVVGVPEHDPTRTRWAWRFAIRPLVVVRDLHDAPPVEAAGVFPQSLWRHSHIRLTREQFDSARALVEAAA